MSSAGTPEPPYYAVIFTSMRTAEEGAAYDETAARMDALACAQPGYLGIETARTPGGLGITVSYWSSLDAIRAWKAHAEHLVAQRRGREAWYSEYTTRICKVERSYAFEKRR